MKKSVLQVCLLMVLIGSFLFLSIPHLYGPASQDDFWNFEAARHLLKDGIPFFYREQFPDLYHPTLYIHILANFMKIFGMGVPTARLLGLVFICSALTLFFFFSQYFFRKEPHRLLLAALSSLFLGVSPMVIQGSQIIDIDGTLLFLTFSLLVYTWKFFGDRPSPLARNVAIGVSFALALWSKLVTPLFLPLGIVIAACFSRQTKRLWFFLKPFVIGVLIFAITWYLYCLQRGFLSYVGSPLVYHFNAAHVIFVERGQTAFSLQKIFGILIRVGGWFSWPFLLFLVVGWVHFQRKRDETYFLWNAVLIGILLGSLFYLFTKGISFSFPKYYVPFLPIFSLTALWAVKDMAFEPRRVGLLFAATVALIVFHIILIGDFLYPLLFGLRKGALDGTLRETAFQIFQKGLLSFLGFFLAGIGIYFCERRQSIKQALLLALVAMTLATFFSQSVLQRRAPYATGNLYGDSSRREVIALLKKVLRQDDVFIAHDLIHFEMGSFSSPFIPADHWGRPEAILEVLERTKARALVYSVAIHTISQYKNTFENPEFQTQLRKGFERHDLGTYTVWIRKGPLR